MRSRTGSHQALLGPTGGRPVALGRTAEIYPWGEGRVLKLFHAWFPAGAVRYEARIARAVHAAGLPVPEVGEIVEVGGRLGLEYERVEGVSMGQVMRARPWTIKRLMRLLADLQAAMHAIRGVAGLPWQRERLVSKIGEARGLEPRVREAALRALERMPDGDRLCHGDFHPENVLLTSRGPLVIDWIDATLGNPLADVARTTVLMGGGKAPGGLFSRAEQAVTAWAHQVYLRRYLELRGGGEEEYRAWLPIVAAGRMSEGIAGLEDWLRAQVEGGLGFTPGMGGGMPRRGAR